jgi:hypothetical protein
MEYLKKHERPAGSERGMDLAGKVLTPKSERPRATWGSLEMSVQTVPGLCQLHRKCIKKDGHSDHCWPGD